MDYHIKIIEIVAIASLLVGGVVLVVCCCMNKKQKLRLPEPPQVQRRMIVSDPTHQPRGIHVDNGVEQSTVGSPKDRSGSRSETIPKPVSPLMTYAVKDSLRKAPKNMGDLQSKRDDGGFAVMTVASTSGIFSGHFGGGGDGGCSNGGCSGGGGGGCGG